MEIVSSSRNLVRYSALESAAARLSAQLLKPNRNSR
jgi:hypothetical protein